jgi:hypothetical protein
MQAEMAMAERGQEAELSMKEQQHQQALALQDAKTADEIRRKNADSTAERDNKRKLTDAKAKAAAKPDPKKE